MSDGLDPLLDFDGEPRFDDEDLDGEGLDGEGLDVNGGGDGGAEPEPEPHFATLTQFAEWLLELYGRSVDGGQRSWCPEWWRHAEVIVRMDAMWRAFEQLRQEPGTGLSVWLRDHVDHHMAVILSDDGPLARCRPEKHADRPVEGLCWNQPTVDPFDRDAQGLPSEPSSSSAGPAGPAARRADGIGHVPARARSRHR